MRGRPSGPKYRFEKEGRDPLAHSKYVKKTDNEKEILLVPDEGQRRHRRYLDVWGSFN
jgi:hypothetical protein